MARTVLLIRHGELPDAYRNRYVGRTDAPLAEGARERYPEWARVRVDVLYSSPLRRARETAALIPFAGKVRVLEDLAEMDFGRWENLTFDEICRIAAPEAIDRWAAHPETMAFPGGESVPAFHRRMDRAWALLTSDPAERVGAVVHGGLIMRVLAQLRGLPTARQLEVLRPRGSVTELIDANGEWHEKI